MKTLKTKAAIINKGEFIGFTKTDLKNGSLCCYGKYLFGSKKYICQIGTGKISRAKKWLKLNGPHYDVNDISNNIYN